MVNIVEALIEWEEGERQGLVVPGGEGRGECIINYYILLESEYMLYVGWLYCTLLCVVCLNILFM